MLGVGIASDFFSLRSTFQSLTHTYNFLNGASQAKIGISCQYVGMFIEKFSLEDSNMNIFQAMNQFPDENSCISFLEQKRWRDNVCCPKCGSVKVYRRSKTDISKGWDCGDCYSVFNVKTDTIFHDTKVPLQKWMLAISIISNAKIKCLILPTF